MLRRWISCLVIVGLLAGQLAAMPHAHGAMSLDEQREHDARPHLHFPFAGEGHQHDEHDHHGHDHGGDQHGQDPLQAAGLPGCCCDDGDAVYLVGSGSLTAGSGDKSQTLARPAAELLTVALPSADPSQDARLLFALAHPPDDAAPGVKLFLKLRTLRI